MGNLYSIPTGTATDCIVQAVTSPLQNRVVYAQIVPASVAFEWQYHGLSILASMFYVPMYRFTRAGVRVNLPGVFQAYPRLELDLQEDADLAYENDMTPEVLAEGVATLVCYRLDLIRTMIAADPHAGHRDENTYKTLFDPVSLHRKHSTWLHGILPALVGVAVKVLGRAAARRFIRRRILPRTRQRNKKRTARERFMHILHRLVLQLGGDAVGLVLSHPFECLSKRMMYAASVGLPYDGPHAAITNIVDLEGPSGLFRGLKWRVAGGLITAVTTMAVRYLYQFMTWPDFTQPSTEAWLRTLERAQDYDKLFPPENNKPRIEYIVRNPEVRLWFYYIQQYPWRAHEYVKEPHLSPHRWFRIAPLINLMKESGCLREEEFPMVPHARPRDQTARDEALKDPLVIKTMGDTAELIRLNRIWIGFKLELAKESVQYEDYETRELIRKLRHANVIWFPDYSLQEHPTFKKIVGDSFLVMAVRWDVAPRGDGSKEDEMHDQLLAEDRIPLEEEFLLAKKWLLFSGYIKPDPVLPGQMPTENFPNPVELLDMANDRYSDEEAEFEEEIPEYEIKPKRGPMGFEAELDPNDQPVEPFNNKKEMEFPKDALERAFKLPSYYKYNQCQTNEEKFAMMERDLELAGAVWDSIDAKIMRKFQVAEDDPIREKYLNDPEFQETMQKAVAMGEDIHEAIKTDPKLRHCYRMGFALGILMNPAHDQLKMRERRIARFAVSDPTQPWHDENPRLVEISESDTDGEDDIPRKEDMLSLPVTAHEYPDTLIDA